MTSEISDLVDESRKYIHKNTTEYKRLNREIRIKIKQAKERQITEKCKEIEQLQPRLI